MVSSILKQTAGILRKQKNSKRWQKGFWCLAIAVVVGTVAILTVTGQALTHKTKVLNCQLEVHEHTDECYDEDDNLICGYADYVVHVHNDDCYDSEGNLVCTLPEIEEHEHTDECYEEQQVLICEAAEAAGTEGHVHTEECYETVETGQACDKEEHTHDDSCYEETLTCNTEEHTHDDGCRDENGELVCSKEEHTHDGSCYESKLTCDKEEHTHDDSCAGTTEKVLKCGKEESKGAAGHTHTEECYRTEKVLTCGKLELHTHEQALVEDGGCYDESAFDEETGEFIEGSLPVCGLLQLEEHTHGEECFEVVEEEPEVHAHSAKCYDEDGNLICGYEDETEEEAHEHDASCYGEDGSLICGFENAKDHEHDANCYDENGYVTCGYKGVKAHEHDADCYDGDGNLTCAYEGVKDHEHDADCYDIFNNLICGYKVVADHVHTKECYDEEGNLICGYEVLEAYELSKTYECEDYIVVARYNADANLPDEAEFVAEQITPDSDSEHYESREAEYRELTGDVDASMRALFKIGFYDENGEEIEPTAPVNIAVQFLDEDGLAEGKPITIIHFAEKGTEKLDGSEAKNNSTTFKMESFSEIGIAYGEEEESRIGEDGTIHLSDSFEEKADPFRIIFHIEGDARPAKAQDTLLEKNEEEAIPVWPEEGETKSNEEEEDVSEDAGTSNSEEAVSSEEENGSEDEIADDETVASVLKDSKLEFHVELLEEGSKMYEAVKNYVGESDDTATRRILQALTYSMTYDGVELDLSECEITAEIIPEESLIQEVQELAGEGEESEVAYSLTALGVTEDITDDIRVKELDSAELDQIVNGTSPVAAVSETISEEKPADDVIEDEMTDDVADEEEPADDVIGEKPADDTLLTDNLGPENGSRFRMHVKLNNGVNAMALSDESTANPTFKVQYYAYVRKLATKQTSGAEAIKIVDTVKVENGVRQDGIKGGAQLPSNTTIPATRNLYVKKAAIQPATTTWPAYEPVYNEKGTVESLTKIYTSDLYEYTKVSGGLKYINKFAKEGMNYGLDEVWVLKPGKNSDSTDKNDWTIYSGADIDKLVLRNNDAQVDNEITIHVTTDTVIRLVGESNTEVNKNYPARFFDYDFTDGTTNHYLKGINHPSNYEKDASGNVIVPRYGFGNNSSGATGLKDDQLDGCNINIARSPADTIIKKCSFGIVESSLSSSGYPQIKANAPDLFNPLAQNVIGKTEITGYELNFDRDGDTYTLTSVGGSENHATNLNQFQKRPDKAYGTKDQIWTNQFWPMDNAATFGDTANKHDPKFGTQAQYDTGGLAVSDDGKEHNSFFGMTFDVEFELTDDYTGPLNYYFFGDDDMWVFLEYPDGKSQLICDIGGVHQAAGEYVDLWNYIQMPVDTAELVDPNETDENRVKSKYKLKFFYTERGASGSTCWMQFTLPSVNSVPVKDYTGNVRNTLKLNKTVEGTVTNKRFDFTITFKGEGSNVETNDYPYEIREEDGTEEGALVESGDIRSGGTFKLGHDQSIEVFNLPEGTTYTITEKADGFEGVLGDGSTGTIEKDKTIEGTIDYSRDDIDDYINKAIPYELPETGGPGPVPYTIAGVLVALLGAGFMYRKKSGKGGA